MSATLEPSWLETIDHPKPPEGDCISVGPDDRAGELGARLAAPKLVVREQVDPTQPDDVAKIVLREHEALADIANAPRLTIALVNTVERAVALYESLTRALPDGAELPVLLHSRFRPEDRQRHIARLSNLPLPPEGRIVVSTQVIEAGIDLDAGAMVTELAPWPSLVQRAGRLNRSGSRKSSPARFVWIDPGAEKIRRLHRPYELGPLLTARSALLELEGGSFSPDDLQAFQAGRGRKLLGDRPLSLLLRRPDIVDLFDTDPTLDGDDPDVGQFTRLGEDLDVGVAWRHLPSDGPEPNEGMPVRDEVCPVPVYERDEIAALEPWRWSYARRRWERLSRAGDILPGDLLLVQADRGGYDPEIGWTGRKNGRVDALVVPSVPPESDADDSQSTSPGRWISLEEHTSHVITEVERLLSSLAMKEEWTQAVRLAAVAHDIGKAHPEFQQRLERWAGGPPDRPGIYAKAPEQVQWRPPRAFRHELVSALLLLERGGRSRDLDLAAYVVAAHHGKLRLTPRVLPDDHDPAVAMCLGVRDGDAVPEVVVNGEKFGPARLDLSLLRIGSLDEATWIERALDLLERLGPFRLAYLEALLRAADQRASKLEREETT